MQIPIVQFVAVGYEVNDTVDVINDRRQLPPGYSASNFISINSPATILQLPPEKSQFTPIKNSTSPHEGTYGLASRLYIVNRRRAQSFRQVNLPSPSPFSLRQGENAICMRQVASAKSLALQKTIFQQQVLEGIRLRCLLFSSPRPSSKCWKF